MATPFDPARPFVRAEALTAGVTEKELRGPRYRKILRGVFIESSTPVSTDERTQAALLVCGPESFASHVSAARLLRLPVPMIADEHVGVPRASLRRRREGLVCQVDAGSTVGLTRGLRCASPLDTFGQLGALTGLVDLVVAGDHMVTRGLVTPESLVAFCASLRGPGAASARRAAAFVRAGVDSPMESRLRLLIVLAGIPEPRINLTIREADGHPIRRYDLNWPEVRVIVEYDGRHHVERVEQWESDLARREAIDEDDWRILVVISRGIYAEPGRTVSRVFGLLQRRGLPGLPPCPSDSWLPHFPGRDGVGRARWD